MPTMICFYRDNYNFNSEYCTYKAQTAEMLYVYKRHKLYECNKNVFSLSEM